jgi:hypothetical protein
MGDTPKTPTEKLGELIQQWWCHSMASAILGVLKMSLLLLILSVRLSS